MAEDQGLNAVDKAVKTALGAAAIIALVPAVRHWNLAVPSDEDTWPVIVFGFLDSDRQGAAFSTDGQSMEYQVKAISQGNHDVGNVGEIAAEIDTVLHGGTLSATGHTIYGVRRQRHVRFIEHDQGRVPYVHAGAIYRIWIQTP